MLSDGAATLHRLTRHGSTLDAADRQQLVAFRSLDPSNRPSPFKRYVGREPLLLPREFGLSSARAIDVLSGRQAGIVERPWDGERLARLLFFSNGVSRTRRSAFGDASYFRTAMSAGNLHPVEIYIACGDVGGIAAGVYHFAPLEFGLTVLRHGDHRSALADAAADPQIADAPVMLILTGIPWRTAWKYGERGFRHLYWDAGTMLGNLLAVEPSASIRVGFVDQQVAWLVDVDRVREYPLALVVLHGSRPSENDRAVEDTSATKPLGLAVAPIARAPLEFPLITAAQRDGDLADRAVVERWRTAATAVGTPATGAVELPPSGFDDPIEAVIVRRGSTRLMRREAARRELLTWGLGVGARPVPGDCAREGTTLLEHFVSVHDVQAVAPGAYRLRNGRLEQGRAGQLRELAAHLCFDQPLGGDAAYTVFHAADLDKVLGALGSPGYRAAQLEAGIAAERLALAAFALGYGATGLTFYDDAAAQFFDTRAACMLVTAVGVPEYRNTVDGRPGAPIELTRYGQLMERLSIQLHRGRF